MSCRSPRPTFGYGRVPNYPRRGRSRTARRMPEGRVTSGVGSRASWPSGREFRNIPVTRAGRCEYFERYLLASTAVRLSTASLDPSKRGPRRIHRCDASGGSSEGAAHPIYQFTIAQPGLTRRKLPVVRGITAPADRLHLPLTITGLSNCFYFLLGQSRRCDVLPTRADRSHAAIGKTKFCSIEAD